MHNIFMQSKQLKTIINANYFTPWGNDSQLEDFLSPPRESLQFPKFNKKGDKNKMRENMSMQEEAKKTLLNIDEELRKKRINDSKSYARKKKRITESLSRHDSDTIKLPPINSMVDYSNCYIIQNDIKHSNLSSIDDAFRKLGQFRGRGKPGAVGRSLSDASSISKDLCELSRVKRRFQTIELTPKIRSRSSVEMKDFKLKGKKFSLDARGQSQRKLEIDREGYLPTQPNITPHHLLLGHRQEEVLKKVLKQLNYRVS